MTIGKNQLWGSPGPLPADGVLVHHDRDIRDAIVAARLTGTEIPTFGLLGGDLARTCGATGNEARLRTPEAQSLPVDLGEVTIDGVTHVFVAHLVARRSWWHGRVVVAMNAQYIGDWDVAPKSHPNDGRVDVLDGSPTFSDRLKARTRLATGIHVPHPDINERRVKALDVEFSRRVGVWLDGVQVGRTRTLAIRVVPDAFTVVV